jgi:hypothetical protein
MINPFIFLCLQTIILWFLVIFFHRKKESFTIIPLYCFIAVITLLTHNLNDLGFTVILNQSYFLIGSFSFFTTLMLGIFFIYLFEGPRAARHSLFIVLGTSVLYIGIVYLLGMQTNTSAWVTISKKSLMTYFWSISTIIIDVFIMAVFWELLKKIKKIPLYKNLYCYFRYIYYRCFNFCDRSFC